MGRTALYRDDGPWRPARAEVHLEGDALTIAMPDGRRRRHELHGCEPFTVDGCVAARGDAWQPGSESRRGVERRFVRMLVLERPARSASPSEITAVIVTPPDEGTVAPGVVRVPEAPGDAAIVEARVWEALADFVLNGGRLAALAVAELARLAMIATPQFATLIGEVAAQRALDWVTMARGPVRGEPDLDLALRPLHEAARRSPRAAEALVAALAHAAGSSRRRRRYR